jgi:hypothetical protein
MLGTFMTRRLPAARRRSRVRLEELEPRTLLSVFTPAQIRQAYGFSQISFAAQGHAVAADGSGQTIALVDAYDDPNVVKDLQAFDRTFGLPAASLTVATPEGKPAADPGWAQEISLDVQWAHAIAPGARLLLVEAKSSSVTDLIQAVDYARKQPGVVAVSLSWALGEFKGETAYDGYFTTPYQHLGGSSGLAGAPYLKGGVTFVAAAGDSGPGSGAQWPSVSPNVLAVGGTTLTLDGRGNYVGETAWRGGGGGPSAYEHQPWFQAGVQRSGWRAVPDVSYAADPKTAFYVYDSVPFSGYAGWYAMGGTSAGAPQWAALVAIADQGRALAGKGSLDGPSQTMPALYKLAGAVYGTYYHDVTKGGNGHAAQRGFDMVTGLGSPVANQLVAGLANPAGAGGGSAAPRTAGTKAPAPGPVSRSLLATPVPPPPAANPGGAGGAPVGPVGPTAPAAPAAAASHPSTLPAFVPVASGMITAPSTPRIGQAPSSSPVPGGAGAVTVAPPLPSAHAPVSVLLESGGGDLLAVLDNRSDDTDVEAEDAPPPGPRTPPPPGPGDAPRDEDGDPWPGCGAISPADDLWLAALRPAATPLWERMDGSPWALCSLAVPAGLAMVVGSCGADPSWWEDETGEPAGPVWREWRRRGNA